MIVDLLIFQQRDGDEWKIGQQHTCREGKS